MLKNSTNTQQTIYRILFLLYSTYIILIYLYTDAYAPDETWFMSVNAASWDNILENQLGYGSMYWIIIKLCNHLLVARTVAAAFMISIPLVIKKIMADIYLCSKDVVLISFICYLSSSYAWFTGKIIGPEIMGCAFGVYGLYFIFNAIDGEKNHYDLLIGSIMMAISASIKLNYFIYLFMAGTYIIFLLFTKRNGL